MTIGSRARVIALSLFIATPAVSLAQGNGQGNAQNAGMQGRVAALEAALADALAAIAQLQAGLTSESAVRATADTTLQANIGAEAGGRLAADTTLQGNIGAEAAARAAGDRALQRTIDDEIQARLFAHGEIAGDMRDLTNDITALEDAGAAVPQSLLDLAPYVSVNQTTLNGAPGPHVIFTGANVHVRSGSGSTAGVDASGNPAPNGRGNLIVGYNEATNVESSRGGSHNMVIGSSHVYTSWGGFVAGVFNSISGPFAVVSGGGGNTATGEWSAVSGGIGNFATDNVSTVSGGQGNHADGRGSTVSGGKANTASGINSTVSGGVFNRAEGDTSTVSGGYASTATGEASHIP